MKISFKEIQMVCEATGEGMNKVDPGYYKEVSSFFEELKEEVEEAGEDWEEIMSEELEVPIEKVIETINYIFDEVKRRESEEEAK